MILSQAITRDGALWVWGCTGMPETADGSMVLCSPTRISDDVKRATGSLVLKNDGTVWTWLNSGRLAGIVNYHTGISSIPGLTEARGLAAAGYHSLVLDSDGKVWAWGSNYVGELGNGSFEWHNPVPSPVVGLADVKAIAAGGWDEFSLGYSVAIKNDGTVWSWGDNRLGQLGCGVFYGQDHMGYDENGDPVHMPDYGFPAPVQVEALTDVVGVAAGTEHTLAVKSDGTVWTWGSNCAGQLGIGSTDWEDARCTPVQVEGLTGVVAVAAAYDYSLALRSDGTVWAWGTNCFGQTGQSMEDLVPPVAPVQVPGLTDVKVIAAGYYHGLAMKTDGTVWAWGGNSFGELGVGTRDDEIREPVQVPGLTNVVAIAAGDYQSLAVKADGTAWAWGDYYGQSSAGPASPTQVLGLKGVKALAAGTGNSFFIADAGSESRPIVTGTWPIAATVERPVHHIVIGFDRPVTNVSVDDLVLSTGTVVSVQGSDSGPYLFTVTDLPGGAIAATLGGDIAGEDGITLASYQWTFTNRPLGDINNDICVNVNDLQLLVASWGQPSTGSGYVADADLNHDGNINVGDLQLLVADWGK